MADSNTSRLMLNVKHKKDSQSPANSLSPSTTVNSSSTVSSCRTSIGLTKGSTSSKSRVKHTSNGQSNTILMEPSLQALLAAESRATEMIAKARAKRRELIQYLNRESQDEIEAFRQHREAQYKKKLYEATRTEQFQAELKKERHYMLEQMEKNIKKQRQSIVNYIIHCVTDQISVEPHRNMKYIPHKMNSSFL